MNKYKTIIKDRLPLIYSALQHINGRRLYYRKDYIQTCKRLVASREKERLPRIAFLVVMPQTWNSFASVYKEAIAKGLQVLVLAVPYQPFDERMEKEKDDWSNCRSYVFLKEAGIKTINAFLSEKQQWFDLESWKPDYVFYTRTYDSDYPEIYRTENVSKFSRICVIPYGYHLVKGTVFDIAYGAGFFSRVANTFATNASSGELLKNRIKKMGLIKYNKVHNIGYPRFDLYIDYKGNEKISTIAWLPRFVFQKVRTNYPSHFLDYYELFLVYAKAHPEIQFIIRPHPFMFSYMVANNVKTQEEVDVLLQKAKDMGNVCFDFQPDYVDTLVKADVLIADFTSLIAEFLSMGKPVVFCDTPDLFLDSEMKMADLLYPGLSWNQIIDTVDDLREGKDPLKKKREKYRQDIFSYPGKSIGAKIIDYLVDDYCQ